MQRFYQQSRNTSSERLRGGRILGLERCGGGGLDQQNGPAEEKVKEGGSSPVTRGDVAAGIQGYGSSILPVASLVVGNRNETGREAE